MNAVAQRIAMLAQHAADAKAVDAYEAVRQFRAFQQRCDIARVWEKTIAELTEITAQRWREERERENEREEHPCDDPNFHACLCAGACSCHWIQLEALPAQVVRESRKQLEALQARIKRDLDGVNERARG